MAVPTLMTAIGLTAALTLAGQAAPAVAQEESGGRGPLEITLETDTVEDRLNPGDRVEYTIRVHNTGDAPLARTQVVQFVPGTMEHVSGSGNAEADGAQVAWDRPLEAGEQAILVATAEVTDVPEGASHSVATVCARPEAGAPATACTAAEHPIHGTVPWPIVTASALLLLAVVVGAVGYVRYRETRRPRPEPPAPSNHTPGSVPNVRTFPGAAQVYHLDVHR